MTTKKEFKVEILNKVSDKVKEYQEQNLNSLNFYDLQVLRSYEDELLKIRKSKSNSRLLFFIVAIEKELSLFKGYLNNIEYRNFVFQLRNI